MLAYAAHAHCMHVHHAHHSSTSNAYYVRVHLMAELDGVHIPVEATEASIAWSTLGGRNTPFQEQSC